MAILFLPACEGVNGPALSGSATITFLQINDLHAHLTPHLDRIRVMTADGDYQSQVVERGGLARLATVIKSIRNETKNTFLMNIGDTYHGGAEALFSNGNAIVDPVNLLGIDVGVPGNWDFAYGPTVTRQRYQTNTIPLASTLEIKRPNFPNLAANVTLTLPPTQAGNLMLPAVMLHEIDGVKVGVIGITSDIVPAMHEILATGFEFLQGEENYRQLINTHTADLRSRGAKIVVVMSELGIQKDYKLGQIIDQGVDVIFSAHTHEITTMPLTTNSGAVVVEAGNDGYLGRMDIVVEFGEVVDLQWQLITIGNDIAGDMEVAEAVVAARASFVGNDVNVLLESPAGNLILNQSIDTVIGYTDQILDRRHALESSFNNAFTEILKQKAGTQLALSPGFRFDSVLLPAGEPIEAESLASGEVTLEDVYRFFPVVYSLVSGETTGVHLKGVIENNLSRVYSNSIFSQGGGWLDGFSGIDITLNLSHQDGQRIVSLVHSGTNIMIEENEILSIAGCQRPFDEADVICSYPGFSNIQPLFDSTGRELTPQSLMIEYLQTANLRNTQNKKIIDNSGVLQWPVAEFIQPLNGVPVK